VIGDFHPEQPDLDSETAELWLAALEDAGMAAQDALLYMFAEPAATYGWTGWYLPRSRTVYENKELPELDDTFRDELNEGRRIDATKVLIWRGRVNEETAARICHELEHARQYEEFGQKLMDLYGLCDAVVRVRVGGLPGGSLLYTVIPIELDANAAAARFTVDRFGEERVRELLSDNSIDGTPFRSLVGPGDLQTLPERMLAFLAAHRDLAERYAESVGGNFASVIDVRWPGTGDKWDQLLRDDLALPR
jgi:hypothetical protein